MEARAINRYIGTSPRKMRLVIDLIRGKRVPEALHILHFSPKHASKVAEKVLRSAVANLQNMDEGGRLDPEEMVVKTAMVDGGMIMKRISPAPMGRAFRIRKRSNHITIVVEAVEGAHRAGTRRPAKARGKAAAAPAKVSSETGTNPERARKEPRVSPKGRVEGGESKGPQTAETPAAPSPEQKVS